MKFCITRSWSFAIQFVFSIPKLPYNWLIPLRNFYEGLAVLSYMFKTGQGCRILTLFTGTTKYLP